MGDGGRGSGLEARPTIVPDKGPETTVDDLDKYRLPSAAPGQ